ESDMGAWHQQLHDRIESADGPAVIAYWDEGEAASEQDGETRTHDWHRHLRGQVYCIESGLLHVRTRYGSWLLPPHRAGWMPPGELHTVSVSGPMSGWGLFIAPEVRAGAARQQLGAGRAPATGTGARVRGAAGRVAPRAAGTAAPADAGRPPPAA